MTVRPDAHENDVHESSVVIDRLKILEPRLRAHGAASLSLYGSYARDEAGPDSDIDVLADFAQGQEPDLARYMGAYHALADAFPGIRIGFGSREGSVPIDRPHIERSAVRVI